MSKLDALTNFEVFIKFMRKKGFLMKKMLAKAVVLGLVLVLLLMMHKLLISAKALKFMQINGRA